MVRFAVPAKKSGTVGTVPTIPGATVVYLGKKSHRKIYAKNHAHAQCNLNPTWKYKMATTFSTGTQSPTSHKPLEKIFEEAQSTGAVCLCGRKLREYPKISSRYDLIDTISAGECPCSVSLSSIHNSIMIFRQKFSVYVCQFCSLINLKQQLTRNYNNKVQTTSTIVFWRRIILDDGDSLAIELEMTVIFVSNTTNKKAST